MGEIKGLIKAAFAILAYGCSKLVPRNKKLWVYTSLRGKAFSDNPKYLYLAMLASEEFQYIKPYWITKNKKLITAMQENGMPAVYRNSIRGLYIALRAGVYVYDHYVDSISFPLSGGALKVNTWHGIPLKKINYDNKFDTKRNPPKGKDRLYYRYKRFSLDEVNSLYVSTSPLASQLFTSAFRASEEKLIITGYPRNDVLLSGELNERILYNALALDPNSQGLISKNKANKEQKVVLYMPTFRSSEGRFYDIINLKELDGTLAKENILLVIKAHPFSKLAGGDTEWTYKNIIQLDKSIDAYPILKDVDALITDYSSIYFDFLLLNRPIIFFPFDKDEYIASSRELYFEYDEVTPGPKVYNQEELVDQLKRLHSGEDEYADNRAEVTKRFFTHTSGSASLRLAERIEQELHKQKK